MSAAESLAIVLVLAACVIIVARCEPALNSMGRRGDTPRLLFVAFLLLTIAAAAQIVDIITGHLPTWPAGLLFAGAASLLLCERRLRYLSRQPPARRGL